MHTNIPIVSLVVRLKADQAEHGELVGHAEVVDTGEVVAVRGAADLAQLVSRVAVGGGLR